MPRAVIPKPPVLERQQRRGRRSARDLIAVGDADRAERCGEPVRRRGSGSWSGSRGPTVTGVSEQLRDVAAAGRVRRGVRESTRAAHGAVVSREQATAENAAAGALRERSSVVRGARAPVGSMVSLRSRRTRVFRRNTSTPRSGLAGKRSVREHRVRTHQIDGRHGPVELGVAVAQGRRRGAPRMFVLVQQPGDVIRAADHVAVGTWKKRAAVSDGNEALAATRGETRAPTGRAETITKRRDHGADARARRTTDEARSSRRRSTRARQKSCGGLKSGAGTKSRVRDDAGTRVPPRWRRRELIPPRGTRIGLTSPEHLRCPVPGPPPPNAFAGLRPRKPQWYEQQKATCLVRG